MGTVIVDRSNGKFFIRTANGERTAIPIVFLRRMVPLIEAEIYRQEDKWGIQEHDPNTWNMIVAEEYGEMVKAINDAVWGDHVMFADAEHGEAVQERVQGLREQRYDEAMKELIETMACLVHLYRELEQRKKGTHERPYQT